MRINKYRILDANLNRAREALRVLEDIVRFSTDDSSLSGELKKLRHDLSGLAEKIYPKLLAGRDSSRDVGRATREKTRRDARGILIANFKRVQEAMRVLEEFAKLISVDAGNKLKRIRFRVYSIEKKVMER